MSTETPLTVKVQGDFALFTRPEFSAERVSYTVMTPSAARGILGSIFWKPEMRWRALEIQVLQPIKQFSILRNDVYNTCKMPQLLQAIPRQGINWIHC